MKGTVLILKIKTKISPRRVNPTYILHQSGEARGVYSLALLKSYRQVIYEIVVSTKLQTVYVFVNGVGDNTGHIEEPDSPVTEHLKKIDSL